MIPFTIIASRKELPPQQRIWGTGGWTMPREREALDWLTLGILLGWDPVLLYSDEPLTQEVLSKSRVVVVATDPASISFEARAILENAVQENQVSLIATAAPRNSPWAEWAGVDTSANGPGVVIRTMRGRGRVITLGFHPSESRDASAEGTLLLRNLLLSASPLPVEWQDLSGVVILRMDDPGGAQNVHSRSWCYPKINARGWEEIGNVLRARNAQLSIGYVSGWLDDGAADRGRLWVGGQEPQRVPGWVYPSRLIRHEDLHGHAPRRINDYEAEYRSIQTLIDAGLVSAELHGYTHMHPDRAAWLAAPDRYESNAWFRELGAGPSELLATKPLSEHPLAEGIEQFKASFGYPPSTLICPGEEFTNASLEAAMDLGIRLVGSYYLGVLWHSHLCWCTHVCSPYLDQPDAKWFSSGLPVVGYFHDKEPAEEGVGWLRHYLQEWERCGAKQFMDYATLAAKIASPGEEARPLEDPGNRR